MLDFDDDETHINVIVTKSNCAISDKACVKGVEITHGFHMRNEGCHAEHKSQKYDSNDGEMKPIIILQFFYDVCLFAIFL